MSPEVRSEWRLLAIAGVLALLAGSSLAAATDRWGPWYRGMREQCPKNHGEWLVEASANDALEDFIGSLQPASQREFTPLLDPAACNGQSTLFSCLDGDYLRVIEKMRLYPQLVAFTCRHYRCGEIGTCDRTGLPPFK